MTRNRRKWMDLIRKSRHKEIASFLHKIGAINSTVFRSYLDITHQVFRERMQERSRRASRSESRDYLSTVPPKSIKPKGCGRFR